MPRIAIIVSGTAYQEAAAWAAATYAKYIERPEMVSVLVPMREALVDQLERHSERYGFKIERFPLILVSRRKFTCQLKCQGFVFAVSQVPEGDLIMFVDADTWCIKPIAVNSALKNSILSGRIGMVRDVTDGHSKTSTDPWYLSPHERSDYFNSGVILASGESLLLFRKFLELSQSPEFLCGPYNDQKVINFAIGKFFRHNIVQLDTAFNGMRQYFSPESIIGHCADGAGLLAKQAGRKSFHERMCISVLDRKTNESANIKTWERFV